MNNFQFLGNIELLKLPKVAFLSSDQFSASGAHKSHDWANEMKLQNQCVISGFQSNLERDVFETLLKGAQPIIMALAQCIYDKPPLELKRHIDSGRLLIVSQFAPEHEHPTRKLAYARNRMILDLADSLVIAHAQPGGMLEKLIVDYKKPITVFD